MAKSIDGFLGLVGGMGPLAGADLFMKLIEETEQGEDGDLQHIPTIVYSDPTIPSRPQAILAGGPSPAPVIIEIIKRLERMQTRAVAIPCVTVHRWYEEISSAVSIPVHSILDATVEAIRQREPGVTCVGVIGTQAAMMCGLFQRHLTKANIAPLTCTSDEQDGLVTPCIEHVKRGELDKAAPLLGKVVDGLLSRGAERIILGCTELPVLIGRLEALNPLVEYRQLCIDPNRALARYCVRWWKSRGGKQAD